MNPNEIIVYDGVEDCPYLPNTKARMPLRRPISKLTGEEFDERMAEGDRRSGRFLYHTACNQCQACEAIRIAVRDFQPNKSQQKTMRRGNEVLETIIQEPIVDRSRVDLYNAHSFRKGLNQHERTTGLVDYKMFLADTCCETIEFTYLYDRQLAGVAIADRGKTCLSAVYCFYDLDFAKLSPGTFSILKQIEYCREWGLEFLYLGYYVAANEHMRYKARYLPHQRLINGQWEEFCKED